MAVDLHNLIDIDLLSYFKSKLDLLFANKVDKVDGKGLSSNDFTSSEKTKLANIASGAQVNVLEGIQKNGTAVTITNKIANITVPTKTSDITNDSHFASDASYVHTDNNYTTTDKNKLAGIDAGAQVNVIESIKVNGTARTVTSKAVSITVPTKTSELTNDSNLVVDAAYVHTDSNYTSSEKTKLSGIDTGAQVNKIESVKVNGTALTITSKAVNVVVPTKTSDITNDSGFITISDVPEGAAASSTTPKMDGTAAVGTETAFARGDHVHPKDTSKANLASPTFTGTPKAPTAAAGTNTTQIATTAFVVTAISGKADSSSVYTKTEVDNLVVGGLHYKGTKATVAALPSTGNNTGDMWHVTADSGEYVWNGTSWDEMGSAIDLSGYVETSDLSLATNDQIDALFTAE